MGFAPTIQFRKLTWPSSPKLTTYSPSSWSSPQHLAHTLGIEPSQSDLESNSPNLGTLACVCRPCSRLCSIVSHTYICLLPPTNLADCYDLSNKEPSTVRSARSGLHSLTQRIYRCCNIAVYQGASPRHFNLRKHLGRGHVSGLIVLLISRLSSGNA